MTRQLNHGALLLLLVITLLAGMTLMLLAVEAQIHIIRTPQTEIHMSQRHGAMAIVALLAVRTCPIPFVLFCSADSAPYRVDAFAIGCTIDNKRCAFCIVGLDGILRTCYLRKNCTINGCRTVDRPPRFTFPVVCGEKQQEGCIHPNYMVNYLREIPEEFANVCSNIQCP